MGMARKTISLRGLFHLTELDRCLPQKIDLSKADLNCVMGGASLAFCKGRDTQISQVIDVRFFHTCHKGGPFIVIINTKSVSVLFPIFQLKAWDSAELVGIVGYQHEVPCHRLGRNQHVIGTNQFAATLQVRP